MQDQTIIGRAACNFQRRKVADQRDIVIASKINNFERIQDVMLDQLLGNRGEHTRLDGESRENSVEFGQ